MKSLIGAIAAAGLISVASVAWAAETPSTGAPAAGSSSAATSSPAPSSPAAATPAAPASPPAAAAAPATSKPSDAAAPAAAAEKPSAKSSAAAAPAREARPVKKVRRQAHAKPRVQHRRLTRTYVEDPEPEYVYHPPAYYRGTGGYYDYYYGRPYYYRPYYSSDWGPFHGFAFGFGW